MTTFAILLGGAVTPTPRLAAQLRGARVIAADQGMVHAAALALMPELWIGDFDSAGSELVLDYRHVPRRSFPAAKDASDGELAITEAVAAGADRLILIGALGGQGDHVAAHIGMARALTRRGIAVVLTSGHEETRLLTSGQRLDDIPAGARFSLVPLTDLKGVTIAHARFPLKRKPVALGQSLTLSNVAEAGVSLTLEAGEALVFIYPAIKLE
ncbi:MAG TPA: thiamine diphosphokinase [Aestuariivirga sp.]|nr:thiamine diphosphokinase [Aestuariivirga sp.]